MYVVTFDSQCTYFEQKEGTYSIVPNATGVLKRVYVGGNFFLNLLWEKKEMQEGFFCLLGEKKSVGGKNI